MELVESSIIFSDKNTKIEVFIEFAKGDIVRYVLSGCLGELLIDHSYIDNTDKDIHAKCILTYKDNSINIKFVDICWYDSSCYSMCDGKIVRDAKKQWKYSEHDMEYCISMNRDEYIKYWNVI